MELALDFRETERLEALEKQRKEIKRKLKRIKRIYGKNPTDGLSNQIAVLASRLKILG